MLLTRTVMVAASREELQLSALNLPPRRGMLLFLLREAEMVAANGWKLQLPTLKQPPSKEVTPSLLTGAVVVVMVLAIREKLRV